MDEDQWMYDSMMSQEVEMNVENEEDVGLFGSRDEVLQWARLLAHDIGFVAVIMRSNTNTSVREKASFLLIACERSGAYRPKKHNLVRTCTDSRKCGCPFKLRAKLVSGGDDWMVKLICGIHNHEMTKSLVGHPYAGQLTKNEKIVVADMMNSMGLSMRADGLPGVIVTDRDLSLYSRMLRIWIESAHWSLKRLLQNFVGDISSVWEDSIENIIDVKTYGNCGYRAIAALLGIGEESWSLVRNHLHKELTSWSKMYINLVGGIERFEELKCSLLVDDLSKVTIDKWMNITDMRYVIASRYNVIVISLSRQQSMTFFPLRSQPPLDSSMHRVIYIDNVYGNHFVQVLLRDHYPLPPVALLWRTHCHYRAKQWLTLYITRMQHYTTLSRLNTEFVDLGEP
ncbi:uncharacterized protein LOC114424219 [Glycine soja]|uniref:uncharacterized protein LOC114424219 n=1 Tax=Glycine soja TaxID=3848 RepID=UPI00103FBE0D|nr:uncharacterized protein LOC114424219 [Glycine soja]